MTFSRLSLLALLVLTGCGPECLRGHTETIHVPFRTEMKIGFVGGNTALIPVVIPGHDEERFVCDEYAPGESTIATPIHMPDGSICFDNGVCIRKGSKHEVLPCEMIPATIKGKPVEFPRNPPCSPNSK